MSESAPQASGPRGLVASLKALLSTLLAIGYNRVELLGIEIQEEFQRVVSLLIWSAVAAVLGMVALITLTVSIILAVPLEHQWLAAAALAALFVAGCAGAAFVAHSRLIMKRRPFDATLAELEKDRDMLSR